MKEIIEISEDTTLSPSEDTSPLSPQEKLDLRKGEIEDWGEMQTLLPPLEDGEAKLLRGYFRVQLRIERKQTKRALRLSKALDRYGLSKLEDKREDLFKTIDIAVRGTTKRNEDRKYQ